jgi:hypothetical protein
VKLKDFIEDFKNGNEDLIENFFGSVEDFLDFIQSKNLLGELDISDLESSGSNYVNAVGLRLAESYPELFEKYVLESIDEVKKEGDDFYLYLDDVTDIGELVCVSRWGNEKEIAKDILANEFSDYEYFTDTVDDLYRDLIDNLTPENLSHLADVILKHYEDNEGGKVEAETDILESIAEEQGHSEYVQLDKDLLLNRILKDSDSTLYILKETDFYFDLYNLYNNAYNSVYQDEIRSNLLDSFDDYFQKPFEEVTRTSQYDKNKTYVSTKIKLNNFLKEVKKYMRDNYKYNQYISELYYYKLLKENISNNLSDCIDFRMPDYPDYREVENYVNEYFRDYI